jgi:hypothetical protein
MTEPGNRMKMRCFNKGSGKKLRIFLYCLIGLRTSQGSQAMAHAYLINPPVIFRYARLIAEKLNP